MMHHAVPQGTKQKSAILLSYLVNFTGLYLGLKVQNIFVQCTIKCSKAVTSNLLLQK